MKSLSSLNETNLFRFSLVIPTYQRRDVVVASVAALSRQEFDGKFEVIVVVDGSQDGTAEALQQLETPFPFTVIQQSNQGAASARNRGAIAARGEIVLFLDDDMEAHPQLIAEHDRSHREGADVVLGHMPIHPDSPANFLSENVKTWGEERGARLSSPEAKLALEDLLTGQISLQRHLFYKVAGFDTDFTKGGTFGNEDLDFGYRLLQDGYKIVFNINAISWQKYVVTPRQHLRQYRHAGRADVVFIRKHPELADSVLWIRPESWRERFIWRWLRVPMRWLLLTVIDAGIKNHRLTGLYYKIWAMEYWQGVREEGGIPQPRPLRILCYHAISDLKGAPVIENYGVSPQQFQQHLNTLLWAGFKFIEVNEFLRFLQGKAGLPRRAVLLTFDDCYEDLLQNALPILKERKIPAVAFAVSKRLGGKNDWDERLGAPQLQLMDAEGLHELVKGGITIGSHSRNHPMLNKISVEQLSEEITGSVIDLEKVGLNKPILLAYPHGEYDENVKRAVQEAGIQAAFTVEPGLMQPNQDPYQIPRIEILREDVGWKFLWKIFFARSLPHFSIPFQDSMGWFKNRLKAVLSN
ncbi:polysaccharide deacetylase [Crinalium epipsammum PCC 9333]|uniref:Polysaccharide deacetylase n=1 Tax=Crinalium epipsammum PCC 9333 TaxID=1173022 RepID=K9W093_9CYAN|nr:polysaccharide deacetylase family protein [Crinalium epipsammum]AFZ13626.1 polysaccharide deacetylase [Crinalium epipsammum PCC 9333]